MKKVFVSWSGGKDGCLALYRVLRAGMDVRYLANMVSEDGVRSRSHGIRAAVIKKQAEAMGISIVQQRTADDTYEASFIEMLRVFKSEGIEGGVFGDIDFLPHREWVENVCRQAGLAARLPLWGEDQSKLLAEFIEAGFRAVVVVVKAGLLGKELLGRVVDKDFLALLQRSKDVTPCGETSEYHTLVIDGPVFNKRLEIIKSEVVTRGEHHFLEILETRLKTKKTLGR
jgi:diphthine-ammonia ligase